MARTALLALALFAAGCGGDGGATVILDYTEVGYGNSLATAEDLADLAADEAIVVRGYITVPGDEDFFALVCLEDVRLRVHLDARPEGQAHVDGVLGFDLYEDGVVVAVSVRSPREALEEIPIPAGAQVHVKVEAFSGTGPYIVRIEALTP